jgi:hypothetical protein
MAAGGFAAALGLWGCKNGNLFGSFHKEGTGTPAAVLSDAKAALANREFNNAQSYYEKVLVNEPKNSEALYGAATATMGSAGLDLGTLLANVITTKQTLPASGPALHAALSQASLGVSAVSAAPDANSLLNSLDLAAMRAHMNKIICYLLKIRSGHADGRVPRDNINVMVSLAITRTLRAVLRTLDNNLVDIRKKSDGKSYEVVYVDKTNIKDACSNGILKASLDDLFGAVESIKSAVEKVNPSATSTLAEVKDDIKASFKDFQKAITDLNTDTDSANDIPASCVSLVNSYDVESILQPPSQDPGNCLTQGACCAQ